MAGELIVLNGTSSAGKSTLAAEMQRALATGGQCWLILGIDDFLGLLPAPWVGYVDTGAFAEDGVTFERSGEEIVLRLGPIGQALLSAYRRSVAVLVHGGLNVIVDEVVLNEDAWAEWEIELRDLEPFWVRVDCSPDVCDDRERARSDRLPGLARAQAEIVHRYPRYDFAVDTTATPPAELARAVIEARAAHAR